MEKLEKLRELLLTFSSRRKVTLRELQSLIGLLNFCCAVIVPGRAFLRRLIDLTCKVSNPSHRITLNKESRSDIRAWQLFISNFNGKSLLLDQRWQSDTQLHLHTDAAGSLGYAAIFKTQWFFGKWPAKNTHLRTF